MKLKTVLIGSVLLMAAGIFAAENNPLNGIVKLEVRTSTPNYLAPWQQVMDAATGSGVVIGNRRILTNAHNIANSTIITVRKHNTDTIYTAKVEFVDHGCDLATLLVNEPEFYRDITPFEIGETPPLQSEVLAIGYPIGGDGLSMTKGIVSRIETIQTVMWTSWPVSVRRTPVPIPIVKTRPIPTMGLCRKWKPSSALSGLWTASPTAWFRCRSRSSCGWRIIRFRPLMPIS